MKKAKQWFLKNLCQCVRRWHTNKDNIWGTAQTKGIIEETIYTFCGFPVERKYKRLTK